MTTEKLIDVFDGKLLELELHVPGFVLAGRVTDTGTGETWRYAYLSPLVTPGKTLHNQVIEWLDGAQPIGDVQLFTDRDMMNGSSELTLWEP